MRFLDLDLDFFLNKNAYFSESDSGRLSSDYKPWSAFRVRRFLERRCGLSSNTPIEGRTFDSHDKVLYFWSMLIESGRLKIPFEVIHVDAHPDLLIDQILHMTSGFLLIDLQRGLNILEKKQVHPDNYLTFAVAYGWIESLVWIPLIDYEEHKPEFDGDVRASDNAVKEKAEDLPVPESTTEQQ